MEKKKIYSSSYDLVQKKKKGKKTFETWMAQKKKKCDWNAQVWLNQQSS